MRNVFLNKEGAARRSALGQWCEEAVAQYGECVLGFQVLARRVHFRSGELDLVFRGPKGTLLFVEVKGRRGSRFGSGLEALGGRKRERFIRAALEYLGRNRVRGAWELWGVSVDFAERAGQDARVGYCAGLGASLQTLPTMEWVRME